MNTAKFALIYTSLVDAIIEYKKYERTAENFGKKKPIHTLYSPIMVHKIEIQISSNSPKNNGFEMTVVFKGVLDIEYIGYIVE